MNDNWKLKENHNSGIWVTLVLAILLTVLTSFFWNSFKDSYFEGLTLNDAMDYAGIARNIAEGEGIISQYSTPLSLVYSAVPQPDMWRAPGWPLLLAGFQNFSLETDEETSVFQTASLTTADQASAQAGGFCFILAAPLVFILTVSLFANRIAGLVAWLFYLFSPQFLNYSISGMTESLSILLMLLLMVLLFSRFGYNWPTNLLIGLVLGFFYLTRYNALLFVPLILLLRYWQWPRRKWQAVCTVLAGFLIAAAPWLIRNIYLFGDPLFSLQKYELLMFTETYPSYMLYSFPESLQVFSLVPAMWGQLVAKFLSNWQEFAEILTTSNFWGVYPALLLLFFLPMFKLNRKASSFKILILILFILQLGALLVLHFIPRLFYIFTPLLIIGAVGSLAVGLKWLLAKIARRSLQKNLAIATAVIFLGLGTWGAYSQYASFDFKVSKEPEILPQISDMMWFTRTDQTILTNEGQILSWYGNRYAVKLPYSLEMLKQVQKLTKIDGIYITERILWNMPEVDNEWKNVYYNRSPKLAGYVLAKTFKDKDGKCTAVLYLAEENRNDQWDKYYY